MSLALTVAIVLFGNSENQARYRAVRDTLDVTQRAGGP